MKQLVQPELFSTRFNISPSKLQAAGLLDRILNSDTRLFIDPLLVAKSKNAKVKRKGLKLLRDGFTNVLRLLGVSKNEGDVAWKGAYKALNLDERPETGLGYGGASTSGSSRPRELREAILRTAKAILELGQDDPDVIPLMGLFEEGVGPDTLSDMASNLILPVLCEITQDFCKANGITTERFGTEFASCDLPRNPLRPTEPIVLVPRDILRDLPLATDWADVSKVIWEIDQIREAVNRLFGDWSKATVTEKKRKLKDLALQDAEALQQIINALAHASDSYDEKADLDGLLLSGAYSPKIAISFVGWSRNQSKKHKRICDQPFSKLWISSESWLSTTTCGSCSGMEKLRAGSGRRSYYFLRWPM